MTGLPALSAGPDAPALSSKELHLKEARPGRLSFLPDGHDVSHLPAWVKMPKQITDGHLSRLARAHGATLATLDEGIPDSFLIPK